MKDCDVQLKVKFLIISSSKCAVTVRVILCWVIILVLIEQTLLRVLFVATCKPVNYVLSQWWLVWIRWIWIKLEKDSHQWQWSHGRMHKANLLFLLIAGNYHLFKSLLFVSQSPDDGNVRFKIRSFVEWFVNDHLVYMYTPRKIWQRREKIKEFSSIFHLHLRAWMSYAIGGRSRGRFILF